MIFYTNFIIRHYNNMFHNSKYNNLYLKEELRQFKQKSNFKKYNLLMKFD